MTKSSTQQSLSTITNLHHNTMFSSSVSTSDIAMDMKHSQDQLPKSIVYADNAVDAAQDFFRMHFKCTSTFFTDSDDSEASDDEEIETRASRMTCLTTSTSLGSKIAFDICEIPPFTGANKYPTFPSVQFYDHPGDCEADECFSFTLGTRTNATMSLNSEWDDDDETY